MASDVYYTMLFVDQGMGNLITITDAGSTATKYSALIDFGTAKSSATQGTLDFMVKYVKANRAANPPKKPDFDLVVISHQDEDHWNLFPKLMAIYENAPLTVGTLAWGGNIANYKAEAADAVNKLKAVSATTLDIPVTEQSAYAANAAMGPLAVYPANNPEIAFKPVMCNATVASKTPVSDPGSMHLNTVSLMVGVIDVASSKCLFLLPGDATSQTVASLKNHEARASELKESWVLSIPHHGSHKTIADNYTEAAARRVFTTYAAWFAGFVAPKTIGASAGFFTNYRHPHMTVLQLFSGTVDRSMTQHGFVSYQTGMNRYALTSTKWGIFTNYVTMNADGKSGTAKRIVYKYSNGALTVGELSPNADPGPGLA